MDIARFLALYWVRRCLEDYQRWVPVRFVHQEPNLSWGVFGEVFCESWEVGGALGRASTHAGSAQFIDSTVKSQS